MRWWHNFVITFKWWFRCSVLNDHDWIGDDNGDHCWKKCWRCGRLKEDERDELRKRIATLESSYNELIMAVEKKFEGETRHETALRYIQSAELGGEVGKNDNKTTSY